MSLTKPQIEVGSNLFELIEFHVSSHAMPAAVQIIGSELPRKMLTFAVNVAKVREVIRMPEITPCLTNAPEVLGVFNLRGVPIPAVNLAMALGLPAEPLEPTSQVIVTEFSRRVAGFIVQSAHRIRRVSWDKVLPPSSDAFSAITGMMLVEKGDFVFILDFERILMAIETRKKPGEMNYPSELHVHTSSITVSSNTALQGAAVSGSNFPKSARSRSANTVLVVDDSHTARLALTEFLKALDAEVIEFTNGEHAWAHISQMEDVSKTVLISDVEMPRLDGYSLVARIRKDPRIARLPIILHSSLTGEVNRDRAVKAGADAYVSKFNKNEIITALKNALPDLFTKAKVA